MMNSKKLLFLALLSCVSIINAGPTEDLFKAIENEASQEEIQKLITAGADVNARDQDGRTPLHWAAAEANAVIIETLCAAGAKVDVEDYYFKLTPLHLAACESPNGAPINVLQRAGANLNARDKEGFTPLHCAASEGNTMTTQTLCELGAKIDEKNEDGCTPLHISTAGGDMETVQVLIKGGADINALDQGGRTALHMAAMITNNNTIAIIRILVDSGANVNIKNQEGFIPLEYYRRFLLLAVKEQPNPELVDLLTPKLKSHL